MPGRSRVGRIRGGMTFVGAGARVLGHAGAPKDGLRSLTAREAGWAEKDTEGRSQGADAVEPRFAKKVAVLLSSSIASALITSSGSLSQL